MKNPEVKSLFKYKPMNQFTLDIIANNRIFYPYPESFNDPFDTKCLFTNETSKVIADLDKTAEIFPDESKIIAYYRKNHTLEINDFHARLKNLGIVSLAENRKNILMWSHYADNHKGICIEFKRHKNNKLGDPNYTQKVIYTKRYPSLPPKSLHLNADRTSSFSRVIYTKSKCWTYEQEWRTFEENGGKAYTLPGKIKSITFGERSLPMDIEIVQKLILGTGIKLYKAELKQGEFGLKFSKLSLDILKSKY